MYNKVRILFLAANPVDAGYRPRLEEEIREIDTSIRIGTQADLFELFSVWAVRPSDLQTALLRYKPSIIHFSGHGELEGIILEDDDGKMKRVRLSALSILFKVLNLNINTVFLNACFTGSQIEELAGTADNIIGMRKPITDRTAITFAKSFYKPLSFGRSVVEAFELAKSQLVLEGLSDAEIPVLLTKGEVAFRSSLGIPDTTLTVSKNREATTDRAALIASSEELANFKDLSSAIYKRDKKKHKKAKKKKRGRGLYLSEAERDEIYSLIKKIRNTMDRLSNKLSRKSDN